MDFQELKNSFFLSTIYDIAKYFVGYILATAVLEQWHNLRWGGWRLIIKKGDEVLTERKLTTELRRRIDADQNELSVYVKGVVSPYMFLTIDICSEKAKELGLIHIPPLKGCWRLSKDQRVITVDLTKNPPSEKPQAPKPI